MSRGLASAVPPTLLALALALFAPAQAMLIAPGASSTRPTVAQQITWVYANQTSLSSAASFLTLAGFVEVQPLKQKKECRLFHTAPAHYLGVCNSRPAPQCSSPEGAGAPPVTLTLVVPTRADVDAWHSHLAAAGSRIQLTDAHHSSTFDVYAFNYYDTDKVTGLGCYRFEVQSFEDPGWPAPECKPIEAAHASLSVAPIASAPAWTTVTMYDVLPASCRASVGNNDLGNPAGDAFFNIKDRMLPVACAACTAAGTCHHDPATFDCDNPESSGDLVVRKLTVEVSSLDDEHYELCNVKPNTCDYSCDVYHPPSGVGRTAVCGGCFMAPHPLKFLHRNNAWDFWNFNTAALLGDTGGGKWYSLPKADEGRLWRNATIVKTIHADCQAKALDDLIEARGRTCFAGCPQPTNASSACWTECFFATVLGDGHNTSITPAGGVNASDIVDAWLKGFDDPASGGCAPCPPTGPCPSGIAGNGPAWRRPAPRAA